MPRIARLGAGGGGIVRLLPLVFRLLGFKGTLVAIVLLVDTVFSVEIWAHDARRSRQILESGDIEEGLAAASAIGDDRIQKQARGYVTPDSFTHGSSKQRVAWFRKGLSEGTLKACDTFAAGAL